MKFVGRGSSSPDADGLLDVMHFFLLCCALLYSAMQYIFVHFAWMQYSSVHGSVVQCMKVKCSNVPYSEVQCSAFKYSVVESPRYPAAGVIFSSSS